MLHCVVFLYHGKMNLVGLKPNQQHLIFFQCLDTVGLVKLLFAISARHCR